MRHRTTRIAGLGAALALGAAACNPDDLTNINVNPNAPLEAPATATFTSAARLAVARWLGTTYDLRQTELTAQHLAEVQYPETDQYQRLQAGFTSATFNQSYYSELADFQGVVRTGEASHEAGFYGPALVMRTWVFGYLTDSWGDVPYSQAFKGDSSAAGLSPAYDAQQDIYNDFFTTLNRVTTDLAAAPSGANLGAADPIYGGNNLRWRRFSNSLRARHAMRIVNVDPAKARTEFLAAFNASGGLIASNADNAILDWPGDGVYDNPWATNFQTRNDHRISTRLMAELNPDTAVTTDDDPRLAVYARPTQASVAAGSPRYVGLENALEHSQAVPRLTTTSRPGLVFFAAGGGQGFPSFLMTYAEVAFLKAEAVERGWLPGGTAAAAQFYQDGIRASMEQWGVTSATAISTFLAQPRIVYQGGVAGQKQIARQKWVALFTDGGQAWAEWRRTCQPSTVKPGPAAIISEVPRRLQYSTTELSVNAEHVAEAVARQGPDEFLTRMWWDKNPQAAPTWEAGCGVR